MPGARAGAIVRDGGTQGREGNDAIVVEGYGNGLYVCPASASPPRSTSFSSAGRRRQRRADRDRQRKLPLRLPRVLRPTALDLASFRRAAAATTC